MTPQQTVMEAQAAAVDRWATLKTLVSEAADAAEAALLIETHAMNEPEYRGLEHREAVARLLAEAPILQAVYEKGREMALRQMAEEQAAERGELERVLNPPEDDVAKKEKNMAEWIPGKLEAENAAYDLLRKANYANQDQLASSRRVEKRAESFDDALLGCAEAAAKADGVPVHEAAARILKASRALDVARVAAGRGHVVPGSIRCLHTAYRAAVTAPAGQAVAAAARIVRQFDSGPPED